MKLASLFAIALLVVCVPFAHADLVGLYIGVDGGTPTLVETAPETTMSGPQLVYPGGVFGSLDVSFLLSHTNYPGTPTLGQEVSDQLSITNTDNVAHTIEFLIVAQGFSAPVTPPDISLNSQVGGSVNPSPTASSFDFTSCVDATNGVGGCPSTYTTSTGTVAIPGSTFGTNYSGGSSTLISSLGPAHYAIDQDLVLSVGAGDTIGFQGTTTLQSVPEPGSIGWMAGGMILLAGLYKRFRSAKQA